METKTIGKFLTTLRKASGMTQKELAERLNVSDKTVSRWERDDGSPDLSTIPVIAEIFGVTCDELLRGERFSPADRDGAMNGAPSPKVEKQRQRLLAMGLNSYRNQTFVGIGISAVGLIAAMICNLGFLRAYIGFFVGLIFFTATLVMQAICVNNALLRVCDESIPADQVGKYRLSLFRIGRWGITVSLGLFGATLPLILFPDNPYIGLTAGSWFLTGAPMAAGALLLGIILSHFLLEYLVRKEHIFLEEPQRENFLIASGRKTRFGCLLAVLIAVTASAQLLANHHWSALNIAEGTVFHDYTSFRQYMSQEHQPDPEDSASIPTGDSGDLERREIRIPDGSEEGKLVCRYVYRNFDVVSVRTSDTEDGLPVTAISYSEYRTAQRKVAGMNGCFALLYGLECLLVLRGYRKKQTK